jgi:hypothetical protein
LADACAISLEEAHAALMKIKMKAKKRNTARFFYIFLVIVLVVNLILLGLGKIKDIFFWLVIALVWVSSRIINKFFDLSNKK